MYVTFQYQRSDMTIALESGQYKVREEEQGKYSIGLDIYSTAYILQVYYNLYATC